MRASILIAVCICLAPGLAEAGLGSSVIRKVTGQAGRTTAKQTARQFGRQAANKAVQKSAATAAHGAASIATRHFAKSAAASPQFADDLARVYAKFSPRNQRRLVMLAPELERTGQTAAVVARLGTGSGDELIEMLWKHRGKLASAAAVTSLVIHGDDIAAAGAEFVAKPLIDGTMNQVVGPASRIVLSAVVLAGLMILAAALYWRQAPRRLRPLLTKLCSQVSRIVRS
jgi:hypothetical protein